MRRLLDTNAYVAFKRADPKVVDLIRRSEAIHFSIIVLGELLFGFHAGRRLDENQAELEEFLASPFVSLQMVTRATADRFGRIAAQLRRQGTPIPTNDIWIAAQAMETGAILVTADRYFEQVPGLIVDRIS